MKYKKGNLVEYIGDDVEFCKWLENGKTYKVLEDQRNHYVVLEDPEQKGVYGWSVFQSSIRLAPSGLAAWLPKSYDFSQEKEKKGEGEPRWPEKLTDTTYGVKKEDGVTKGYLEGNTGLKWL